METEAQIYDSLREEHKIEMSSAYATTPLDNAFESMNPVLKEIFESLSIPSDPDAWEEKAEELIEYLIENGDEECPHKYDHQFSDGVYYRQVTKGPMEIVVGSRHKTCHQNILLHGAQIIFTSDGMLPMIGPCAFVGESGGRKVTLTLTDVVFANVFANPDNCKDIDELEKKFRIPEREELMKRKETSCLYG
jgi:hypothetical protein